MNFEQLSKPVRSQVLLELTTPDLTDAEVLLGCGKAREAQLGGVVVSPWAVALAARALKGTGMAVVSLCNAEATGKSMVRAIEASSSVKDGATLIWTRPRPGLAKAGAWDTLRDELMELIRAARAAAPGITVAVDTRRLPPTTDWPPLHTAILQGAADAIVIPFPADPDPLPPLPPGLRLLIANTSTPSQVQAAIDHGADQAICTHHTANL